MTKDMEKGFTKNEIIITVLVIGLILSVAGFLLSNARRENRDIKRLADIKEIRSALEFYFYDCNEYPLSISSGQSISGAECGGEVYLSVIPRGPKGEEYRYTPCALEADWKCDPGVTDAESYLLEYTLESGVSGITAGKHAANPEKLY